MRIKVISVSERKVIANVHVNLDSHSGRGYETDIALVKDENDGWVAEMKFSEMPSQESFEDAIDRMGLYLQKMATAIKSKNLKYLNPEPIFKPKHK